MTELGELLQIQLWTTTAEEQASYFTGDVEPEAFEARQPPPGLAAGHYRVVAGDLYRIEPGVPELLDRAR